ncbi:Radical SAM superfamily protein [Phycisphaerae bacterium RAS1]|nr:Radical SAM superfamily protein [Phycisphaerae bacterium RAS1]
MELPRRPKNDVHLPDGALRQRVHDLRQLRGVHDLAIGIMYAFDYRTHMLPFWYADNRMAPCAVRLLADVLHDAGFTNMRVVLQQWSPNVLPSRMRLAGRPLDLLLVSSMQVHAERAYALVRDAHRMGADRPLILAGGPKAIYEPTDFFELGPQPGIGADCAVTGEAFVLLDLLHTVFSQRERAETPLAAFERARRSGALDRVPGLVYLSPDAPVNKPVAINTGMQRLLRDLDELPLPDAGYRLLEPPHRRKTLAAKPCSPQRVGKLSTIASVISTQGCKFNCSYCPIPAVNQRTWRHKSPQRLVDEIVHIHENFGITNFFSTDDNFFNDRQTVIDLMTGLSQATVGGEKLSSRIRFFTEATEFDVHKNSDLLPLCRSGGLAAIWFGIEDITAGLINKGQTAGKTAEMFALLHRADIEPMVMMMHNDAQPLRSKPGDLSGLLNQVRYLFEHGAITYQCTYLGPAIGTRDLEPAVRGGWLYRRVGGRAVPAAFHDGNHVVASKHARPWRQQLNVLRAYAAFYNPLNLLKSLMNMRKTSLGSKRVAFQLIGQIGLLLTAPKMLAWAWRLRRGPIDMYRGLEAARIPMLDVHSGEEINWAIEHLPTFTHESASRRGAAPSRAPRAPAATVR